ncbi:J domain-containing protein [Haloarcula sp. S1AR25-5A]|uniref:J domain-containing protein n=1 Tax=Haloarcula terrestris TaxID=2950533 RepID=A0AAE4EWU5_9EURY|nr:J domain-containing protein [Haloarcula terrestris]MDS0220904.1 J domain-containing protein [Haloarcula terrestris]
MQYDGLTKGIAAVFGVLTVVLTAVGILGNPAVLFLALMFGASTYFMYYHISGKMAARLYERVERQAAQNTGTARRGGFGAGPREEWEPPRDGRRARRSRATNGGQRRRQGRQRQRRQTSGGRQRRQRVQGSSGPTSAEAYKRLGLDPSADQSTIKAAYREKVKEVHPDTDSGSEAEFKQVQAAYETLTDD